MSFLQRLLGPPNVFKLKAQRNIRGLIKALKYRKDPFLTGLAARSLGGLKATQAVEPLIAVVKDEALGAAAQALGKIGDARAVEPLCSALKDERGDVRRAAARGLVSLYKSGHLGDSSKRLILAQRQEITARHTD